MRADAEWRFGGTTLRGAADIARFLRAKFERQLAWHVALTPFCAVGNRIAAAAISEWRAPPDEADDGGWWRTRCNELYEFSPDGRLSAHDTALNDAPIGEGDRQLADAAAAFAELAEQHGLLPRSAMGGAPDAQ